MTLTQPPLIILLSTHLIPDTVSLLQSSVWPEDGKYFYRRSGGGSELDFLIPEGSELWFYDALENFLMRFGPVERLRLEGTFGGHLLHSPSPSKLKSS